MKINFSCIITGFIVLISSSIGFSQTNEIKIRFIGNCGLYLTDGTTNIYSDFPYKSGAHGYMEFDDSELEDVKENSIFLYSHKHSDHYSNKNIKKVIKHKQGQKYGPWNVKTLGKLNQSIPDFNIQAFKTKHKFSLNHYSYLITWHGKRIFISGDTEEAETLSSVKNIDWAIVPYWVLVDAKEKNLKIDAEMYGIYHLATVQIPSAKDKWGNSDNFHPFIEQGDVIKIQY